jgi:hypothetical protein
MLAFAMMAVIRYRANDATPKKRMARPACKRFFDGVSVCANVSGLGAMIVPGQDGAYARTDPHKDVGV